ncbi:MAG TPA: VCBS repeat-containing protein [Planctomycetota bacterium]
MIALLMVLAQDPAYETLALEAGPRTDAIVARDVDGDGRVDLLVQSGRDLQVFLHEKGGFALKPVQTFRLDPSVFLWTLGSIDGQSRPALLSAGSRAIQGHFFEGRGYAPARDLVVHPSLFEGSLAEGRAPVYHEFAFDLDRDGRSEVLLYRKDAIFLMKQEPGGAFRCQQKLPVPVDIQTMIPWQPQLNLAEKCQVPVMAIGDLSGDGRPDLGVYREEAIQIFRQDAEGRFAGGEERDLVTEKRKKRGQRFFQFDLPPRIEDFNGDGLLDLALVYPSKGRVQVYYGGNGKIDFTQPDMIMRVADGWSTGIYVEDLDGDKKLDLIMGVVRRFGITEGIQVFLSGKVDLELHMYPTLASGRFAAEPAAELKFSIPYSFQMSREAASLDLIFRPNFKGDFNKDGLRDMLVATDKTTLRIYPGVKGRLIADQPSGSIAMHPPPGAATTEPFVADLNGDGVSDLLLKHIIVSPPRHVLELKLSK